MGGPNFGGWHVENRDKIGKMPQSPRYLGAIFSVPPRISEHVKFSPRISEHVKLHITSTFDVRDHQKIAKKNCILCNFPTIPSTLHFSLSLF